MKHTIHLTPLSKRRGGVVAKPPAKVLQFTSPKLIWVNHTGTYLPTAPHIISMSISISKIIGKNGGKIGHQSSAISHYLVEAGELATIGIIRTSTSKFHRKE